MNNTHEHLEQNGSGSKNGGVTFEKNLGKLNPNEPKQGPEPATRVKNDLMGNGRQFENPMLKREEFAVTLRKKKSIAMVKAKRRKIMES